MGNLEKMTASREMIFPGRNLCPLAVNGRKNSEEIRRNVYFHYLKLHDFICEEKNVRLVLSLMQMSIAYCNPPL